MPDEYISREAARKEIFVRVGMRTIGTRLRAAYEEAIDAIDNLPAADVVPVARCASCKYVRPTVNANTGEQVGIWCYLHDISDVSPDDFCSRGEKKGATE